MVTSTDGATFGPRQLIPSMPAWPEAYGYCSDDPGQCQRPGCKQDGVWKLATASTSDGAVWLAALIEHEDQDWSKARDSQGNCRNTILADRGSNELVLFRLDPGGKAAPARRWSLSMAEARAPLLALAARGPRLYAAFSDTSVVRVLAFDWSKL